MTVNLRFKGTTRGESLLAGSQHKLAQIIQLRPSSFQHDSCLMVIIDAPLYLGFIPSLSIGYRHQGLPFIDCIADSVPYAEVVPVGHT